MSATLASSSAAAYHRVARDYEIQCDDVSDLVSVSEFKKRSGRLREEIFADHVIQAEDHDTQLEIAETCSTESLLPPGGLDPYLKGKKSSVLNNTRLQCLNHIEIQKEYFERKGLSLHGSRTVGSCQTGPEPDTDASDEDTESGTHATIDHPEAILSLFIYHPLKKRRDTKALVLGSQLLTELRDKILCFRDYIVDTDYSEDPSRFDHRSLMTGCPPNHSKSAFFFINNTFYNDKRYSGSLDLSAPIIEWTRETNVELSPRLDHYSTVDMATTRLDQLSLRLGYPYLFGHHHTCQHLIIFTDLRLAHPSDSQRLSDYPKIFPMHFGQRRLCYVCGIFSPTWVTLEDELAPESPCLFCGDCFKKLHYSSDGEKICNFKAFPYNPTMLV